VAVKARLPADRTKNARLWGDRDISFSSGVTDPRGRFGVPLILPSHAEVTRHDIAD
jgi:hypothetical protein